MINKDREELFLNWQREHRGILLKVARSFALSRSDQEDLVQEMLVQLWLSMDQFNSLSKVSTWIYRVALNTAMSWQRGEKRRRGRIDKLIKWDAYWQERDRKGGDEKLTWLYEAIHRLLPHERSLILLYLDDLPYSEIAKVIGISEGNVGVRISRIRQKLKQLSKEGGEQ